MVGTYDLNGTSIFTILSIGEFKNPNNNRGNAAADARVMRQSLESGFKIICSGLV